MKNDLFTGNIYQEMLIHIFTQTQHVFKMS